MNVKNFKEKAKNWWEHNKKIIGVGLTCGIAGISYGFYKGLTTMIVLPNVIAETTSDDKDDFEYNESNVDDPELLELIKDGSIDE